MRILIVEDEKEILDFLKSSLEAENFVVDITEDGEKGSFLARTNNYDLILLDNALPSKNGKQICKEIRDDGLTVPILMLSIISEVDMKVSLLNVGVDDYMTKPFSFKELLARVNALLRRPHKIEKEVYRIDDLVLDIGKGSVIRGEEKIHLTRKEFFLLEYLLKNKGKLMTRGMIMEHVWDMNADPFSNTIESHVTNLRKKIGGKNKKELIYTMSGRGYKIDLEK